MWFLTEKQGLGAGRVREEVDGVGEANKKSKGSENEKVSEIEATIRNRIG